jgi:hypothetical protein
VRGADRVGHRFVVSSLLSIDLIPICPVTRQERELCRNERNQRVPARGNRQAGNVWSRVVTNEIQSHEKAVSSNERIAIYVRTVHVDNNCGGLSSTICPRPRYDIVCGDAADDRQRISQPRMYVCS